MSGGAMCQLTMNDSYGDGWGGGTLTIDGTDYTFATGASDTADVMVFGTPELVAGFSSYPSEVSWSLDCFEFGLAEGTGDPAFGSVSAGTIATPEMACCGTDVYDASGACCEDSLDAVGTCCSVDVIDACGICDGGAADASECFDCAGTELGDVFVNECF
jgi:hypothetical protein